jgi:uncharacterized CHY-type Zn-finger protein
MPREAEHGLLCYSCHKRLENYLQHAYGQWLLLQATVEPSTEQKLTVETTAKIRDGWRTSTDQPFQGPYARQIGAVAFESEPLRVAAKDVAQEMSDHLAELVERLVDDYHARGPERVQTEYERNGGMRKVWRPANLYREHEGYEWVEPPTRFEVDSAATWLRAQIERLEHCDDIADVFEALADVMSRAHALAPWREQVAKVKGIPCPECQRVSLVRFGGDENVTCLTPWCKSSFTPQRYGIWVQMLAAEQEDRSA